MNCETQIRPGTASRDLTVSIGTVLFDAERETVVLEGGRRMTVLEVLDDFREPDESEIVVVSRDRIVDRGEWGSYVHDHDTPLFVNVVPKNRRVLRLIAVVALAAFSPAIGAAIVGAGASKFATLVATTAVQLIGAVAIERLLGAKPPGSVEIDPQRFGVSGIQNRLPGRQTPVPVIMGKHRIAPYFAAQPYAYVVDSETQGYRALFDCGYGPLTFDAGSYRFGDQPTSAFSGVTVVTHDGTPGSASQISNFNESHNQRGLNRQLLQDDDGGWSEFDYAAGVTKVAMIVVFNGLIDISDRGDRSDLSVSFEVQVQPTGGAWGAAVTHTATGQTTSQFYYQIDTTVGNTGGKIRIRRTTDNHGDDNNKSSDSVLSAIDFVTPTPPVAATGRALVFVEVQANEDINTTIQSFNLIATRRIPRYANGAWTAPSVTGASNPAWLLASVLRGPGIAEPVADADIDAAGLASFAQHCDDRGYAFNAVWTDQRGVWDRLNQVAASGRGSATFIDGNRYGVVIDRTKTVPVDLITPKDALGFTGEKSFETAPHAFRASFANAANDWLESEITVYRDGFTAANATDVRSVDAGAAGATTTSEVHKFLRYLLAVSVLRPEAFTVRQDIKSLRLQRGDYVDLQYDAPLIGLGSGRVTKIVRAGANWTGFELDEFVPLDTGDAHQARFQDLDGNSVVVAITANADGDGYDLVTPQASAPDVGAMTAIGVSSKVTLACLVAGMTAGSGLTAELSLVPLSNAIHDAETGPLPAYDPKVTLPGGEIPSILPDFSKRGPRGFPGLDGSGQEFVFKRTSTATAPTKPTTTDAQDQTDDHVPSGWTDDPTGPDASNPFEWVSERTRARGADKWGKFGDVAFWAIHTNDGEDGTDGQTGASVEFVFRRTTTATAPSTPASNNTQRGTDDYVPSGWTDEPTGPNATYPYEWVCGRVRGTGAALWTNFASPSLWAVHTEDGEDGRDGKSIEFIFKRTTTSSRPSTPSSSNSQRGQDDYVPSGWTDDPTGPNATYPYEWVCIRVKAIGAALWTNFTTPAEWANHSEDGEDGEDAHAHTATGSSISLTGGSGYRYAVIGLLTVRGTSDNDSGSGTLRLKRGSTVIASKSVQHVGNNVRREVTINAAGNHASTATFSAELVSAYNLALDATDIIGISTSE